MVLETNDALIKLSLALNVAVSDGSSPLSLTNQPRGIAFNVYSVPDLSVRKVATLGGIPIPNSNTCTPVFFAAIKCHNSWIITKKRNNTIHNIIQTIKRCSTIKTIPLLVIILRNKYNSKL